MQKPPRYWFPAKRYGWGWGPPCTWQGWVVLVIFLLLTIPCVVLVPRAWRPQGQIAAVTLLSLLLIMVCRIKGEPPRWRWGDGER